MLRLETGEQITEKILDFCSQNKILSGWIWGIGGLKNTTLAYFDVSQKKYQSKKLAEVLELVSLTGNIAEVDGKPFAHLHAVLSGKDMQAVGGHLVSAEVAATCEVLIRAFEQPLKRAADDDNPQLKMLV